MTRDLGWDSRPPRRDMGWRRTWSSARAMAVALGAAVALVACGGGSSGGSSDSGPSTPPAAPTTFDRIEPLDTATLVAPRSAQASATPQSRLPTNAEVDTIPLAAPLVTAEQADLQTPRGLRIGVAQAAATASAAAVAQHWHWVPLAGGGQVAAIAFTAPDAAGLRLGLDVGDLRPGAVLRFVGDSGRVTREVTAAQVMRTLQLNADAAPAGTPASTTYWGPIMEGSTVLLELELPPDVDPAQVHVAVPRVSRLTMRLAAAARLQDDGTGIGAASSCTVNLMCTPGLDAVSRAVARVLFTDKGDTFLCTGTLLNDIKNSQTPYFLTAMHCVPDQATASTVETYWFYRATNCADSTQPDTRAQQVEGGAQLLTTVAVSDSSFLQLLGQMPADVVYSGSYFGADSLLNAAVVGVSNPEGDLQKVTSGGISGWGNCGWDSGDCTTSDASSGGMFTAQWTQGVTEEGSSGSPLFTQIGATRYLVAGLHAGSSSCTNPAGPDFYGRFERAFVGGVKTWLAPGR